MKRRPRSPERVTFDTVVRLALALPGVEEGTSYGTPAVKVRGKLLARLKEDGESIAVKVDFDTRDMLTQADPETFYITDHYRDYPAMLVRLATVRPDAIRRLLEDAWRRAAPKTLRAAFSPAPRAGSNSRKRRGP